MTRKQAVRIVKPPVTWILVADSRRAQVYIRQKTDKLVPLAGNSRHRQFAEIISREPVPVKGMQMNAEPVKQYEVGRQSTGTVFESASSTRHMSEPRLDVRDEIREHFAKAIAEQLSRAREKKFFDRLVLIAPAKMLGEIKKHLGAKMLKLVAAEMPKDLTHYDAEQLEDHLGHIA